MEAKLQKVTNFLEEKYGVEVTIKDFIEDGIEIAELVNKRY